jgi:hypothetical protein
LVSYIQLRFQTHFTDTKDLQTQREPERSTPSKGTPRAGRKENQIRKAQFRVYNGGRFAFNGAETETTGSDTGASGKVQTNEAGARVKS